MRVNPIEMGAARRKLFPAIIGVAVPGAAAALLAVAAGSVGPLAPVVHSAPDPCAASEVARTIGSVAKQIGDYLDSHPETNQAMTNVLQQPAGPQSVQALKSYFEANPKVGADMTSMSQPLANLSTQCKLPITIPQALGFAQAAQAAGGLPPAQGASPAAGAAPAAPVAGPTTSAVPAQPRPKNVG